MTHSRLRSLDIFRGAAVAAMIIVNNPGSDTGIYAPLVHAEWDGWTFADTIFPAFLWIMGLAMAISTEGRLRRGDDCRDLFRHASRRALVLLCLGILLEAAPAFKFHDLQWTGVLQKIAICYTVAFGAFLVTGWRGQVVIAAGLNVAYVALMVLAPVPECSDEWWSAHCNFARFVDDRLLAGHLWLRPSQNDPDGILTLLTATSTVLLGAIAGKFLLQSPNQRRVVAVLIWSGVVLFLAGRLLTPWVPINKTLWSSSYVLLMAGLASTAFGIAYWAVDVRRSCTWLRPLEILGMNALAAYVLSRLAANGWKIHVFGRSLYTDAFLPISTPENASLLFALTNLGAVYVVVWFMYRRQIFLKL